ncbi:MAG: DNA protecting protein DprA [Rhodocyclales bacterium GWA2_65_20]|nr:MAG: DNA protecting protein DprA [Rhodocyclales bacterium GWA2_65_20]
MAESGLDAWVRLTLIPGVGGETQRQLLKAFGLPAAIFAASRSAVRAVAGETAADSLAAHDCQAEIKAALAWAQEAGNRIVTLADPDYPQALLATADPPVLLYAKGRTELLNRPALAIVGSRNATRQGEANATAFAAALSAAGLTIVSGLALGCDAAAHRGALDASASTIAVIGTGADRIYPARNAGLARQIAEKGVVISEFPLGTPPLPPNFPRRNRLIAGISRGCLVVEAAEQSGSLITARLAAETGSEVFAIPGSIHSPLSKGCHKLIKQGAKLVESAADILEELRWESVVSPVERSEQPRFPAPERGPGGGGSLPEASAEGIEDPILDALGHDLCGLDTLAERTGLPADALLARLLPLELDGRVAQLPGGRYQRLH